MKISAALVLAAAHSLSLAGQPFNASLNPVCDSVREVLARDSRALVASAERMPSDKYGFHPTPAQMTFGQLVAHIVQTNVALCAAASGAPAPDQPALAGSESKDVLVDAIKKSFDFCTQSLASVTDKQLGEEAMMFGRASGQSRAMVMVVIATDWADHYSTAASYLLLNGILPPTAKP